jgi:PhnB protein
MKKQKSHAPGDYSSVCPYLMVESVEKQLEFLTVVFNAETNELLKLPDGTVQHGEVRVGDTVIMMGKARPEWPATCSTNYVFVDNTDDVYKRALLHGASSLMEPANRYYGYREGGLKDPQGNSWWIAQVVEEISETEMQERLLKLTRK